MRRTAISITVFAVMWMALDCVASEPSPPAAKSKEKSAVRKPVPAPANREKISWDSPKAVDAQRCQEPLLRRRPAEMVPDTFSSFTAKWSIACVLAITVMP